MDKQITIILYRRDFVGAWHYNIDLATLADFAAQLDREFQTAGVRVCFQPDESFSVKVSGYGDLLNAVRLRSSEPGTGTPCLGHIIGQSKECKLLDDIRRAVSRLAFAAETIAPDDAHRRICHNCGCGC